MNFDIYYVTIKFIRSCIDDKGLFHAAADLISFKRI